MLLMNHWCNKENTLSESIWASFLSSWINCFLETNIVVLYKAIFITVQTRSKRYFSPSFPLTLSALIQPLTKRLWYNKGHWSWCIWQQRHIFAVSVFDHFATCWWKGGGVSGCLQLWCLPRTYFSSINSRRNYLMVVLPFWHKHLLFLRAAFLWIWKESRKEHEII